MKTFLTLSLLSIAGLVAGCSVRADDASTSRSASTNDELDAQNESDLAEVQADRIIYPARYAESARVAELVARANAKTEPVYLVGDRRKDALGANNVLRQDSKNRNGYLRRVVSVETAPTGDVVFHTEKASLTEAQAELARKGFRTLSDQGCFPHEVNPFDLYQVDLSRVLYERSIGSIGNVSLRLKDSRLSIDGSLETGVTGACMHPDDATGLLTLNMKGQVVLEGAFDGAFGAATGELPLFHEQIAITSVAGYPLALDLAISGDCEFSSNGKVRAEVGAKVSGSVAAGASWTRGEGFDTSFTPSWSGVQPIGPSFSADATVTATCVMRAKALALVFDSDEGPYVEAATTLGLEATGSGTGHPGAAGGSVHAKGTLGVDVGLGGTLKPFHVTLVERIDAPHYRKDWTLFDRTFTTPH